MSEETNTPQTEAEETTQAEAPVAEAPKAEAPKAAAVAEEVVEVPEKFKSIVDAIEKMPVLELNELVKVFEKKFGVSATAVAAAGPAAGGAGADEQTEFAVELTSDGGAKIPVMKVVKDVLGLGLKEAKDIVDALPAILKEGMKKEDAEALKAKIEEAGGKVTLK
ncbi:MAG: 50S ribosomal protein L7/L12 [Candidatus Pacebacteria bacterium]|nr:50S ribosomal protein L7/L12 [Candidatus Paceibacterota bacterium]